MSIEKNKLISWNTNSKILLSAKADLNKKIELLLAELPNEIEFIEKEESEIRSTCIEKREATSGKTSGGIR